MNSDTELNIKSVVKRRDSKYEIAFSDGSIIICSYDLVLKFALVKGDIVSPEKLNKLKSEQRIFDVKQAAYSFGSYKPRTLKQVRDKLRMKKFSVEEIEIGINFLYEFNFLDDKRFAKTFVKDYLNRKQAGKPFLVAELRKRGIDKDLAEGTVEEFYPEENELELAMVSAEKKLRSIAHKPKEKRKNLLVSHLQRKGFNWDIIKQIIGKVYSEE